MPGAPRRFNRGATATEGKAPPPIATELLDNQREYAELFRNGQVPGASFTVVELADKGLTISELVGRLNPEHNLPEFLKSRLRTEKIPVTTPGLQKAVTADSRLPAASLLCDWLPIFYSANLQ